jgi:Zn-finger protein
MFEEYVQQDYVEEVNSYYCSMYENEIENLLNSKGISCDKCMVIGKLNNKTFVVDEIIVDIKKSGIQTEDGHIIDIEEIKKLLCDMLSVSADMVCVNER